MTTTPLSRRDLVSMLEAMGGAPMPSVVDDADSLASRLRSLAIAGSFEGGVSRGRWGRRVVAVVGAVGLVGWTGLGVASASVGLAVTGNLPAPVQDFVSDVFEVVGLDLPKSAPEEQSPAGGEISEEDEDLDDDEPVDPDLPDDGVTPPTVAPAAPGNSGNAPGIIGNTPGQSGNTPGQSGTRPPGQSGDTPGQSGARPPGQSGNTPGRPTLPESIWPTEPSEPDSRPGNFGNSGNSGDRGDNGNRGNGRNR